MSAPLHTDRAILDLARLVEVYEDDNAGIIELLELMLKTNARYLDRLSNAVEARDMDAVREAAHGIKGSAGNVGAIELQRAAQELEALARDASWEGVTAKAQHIRPAYDRLYAQIEKLRAG